MSGQPCFMCFECAEDCETGYGKRPVRRRRRLGLQWITTPEGITGYYLDDIKAYLTPKRWEEFTKWYYGQTGAIENGKALVYQHDWEGFVRGWKSGLGGWD